MSDFSGLSEEAKKKGQAPSHQLPRELFFEGALNLRPSAGVERLGLVFAREPPHGTEERRLDDDILEPRSEAQEDLPRPFWLNVVQNRRVELDREPLFGGHFLECRVQEERLDVKEVDACERRLDVQALRKGFLRHAAEEGTHAHHGWRNDHERVQGQKDKDDKDGHGGGPPRIPGLKPVREIL